MYAFKKCQILTFFSQSFASNLVQDSPSDYSLDDFLPSQHSSQDEINSLDDILPVSSLQNVKTLDELYPSEELVCRTKF